MDLKTSQISPKLKERFCKDCGIPINLFEEPYFTSRLQLFDTLYDSVSKWTRFIAHLPETLNEEIYFAHYNKVKDAAINDIKESAAYQQFNNEDMNNFTIPKRNISSKDIFKPSNHGKTFISIDMCKANFSALRHYDEAMFKFADTWVDFISQYTTNLHIIQSKYVRQVILGNCNPRRHITYEKYLMNNVLETLLRLFEINEENIVFFSNDEIVIEITEKSTDLQIKFYHAIKNSMDKITIDGKQIPLKTQLFRLYKIQRTEGYCKIFHDDNIEFKCLNAHEFPFVLRTLENEEIHKEDKIFKHQGLLAEFTEIPKIILPTQKFQPNDMTYNVNLKYLYDDQNDDTTFVLYTPHDINTTDVKRIIWNTHIKLDSNEADCDYYGNEGRNADTLLWYINKKFGWEYKKFEPDLTITLH